MTRIAVLCAVLLAMFVNPALARKPAVSRGLTYRGRFFEIQYPAGFQARSLDAAKPSESNAATFAAPDGAVEFYVFSPQWGGEAPGIAFDPKSETQAARTSEKAKGGTLTWITYTAKDKSYTRTYQDSVSKDGDVHWVIGLKYRTEADSARYKPQYLAFKASLRQLAD